jgi:V/A-type H+-transporting ATPase subunit A
VTIGGTVSPAGGNFEEPVTQGTLKVVGAFHGLSRDRSNARRFPAIHPLDSWSHYPSIVEPEKIEAARRLLQRGNEVNQMMKVVGEEGTHTDDYMIYQKSEFLDYVYLQQNTFDKVDGATSRERQIRMFDKVLKVLESKFKVDSKDDARRYMQELRQLFIDWNYSEMDSDDFNALEKKIDAKIAEKL